MGSLFHTRKDHQFLRIVSNVHQLLRPNSARAFTVYLHQCCGQTWRSVTKFPSPPGVPPLCDLLHTTITTVVRTAEFNLRRGARIVSYGSRIIVKYKSPQSEDSAIRRFELHASKICGRLISDLRNSMRARVPRTITKALGLQLRHAYSE